VILPPAPALEFGITGNGVVHTDADSFEVDTRFRMVKEAGVFDYYDKTPPPGEIDAYLAASAKEPRPGEWHSQWDEQQLEPWKEIMRQLLRHHASSAESTLQHISTELLPGIDYGGGARYSIFDNNVACAVWLRDEWARAKASPTHMR